MKTCELCKSLATIYCESDQASLCWSCDAKVHSANFLAARHSRNLLCRSCQSPTPWSAAGEKFVPSTASICERCVVDGDSDDDDDEDREESDGGNDEDEDEDEEYDGDEEGGDEIDLEDNQVVPWSSTPPPPALSSSISEECSFTDQNVSVKRKRPDVSDLSSEEDLDCSSMHRNHRAPSRSEATVTKLDRSKISGENESQRLFASVKQQEPLD